MAKANLMTTKYLAEEDKHSILSRLNRACGQINAVRNMVEESECVDKLLIQISAAKSALTQAALELMEKHLVNCAETWMPGERQEVIRRVTQAVAAVIRNG